MNQAGCRTDASDTLSGTRSAIAAAFDSGLAGSPPVGRRRGFWSLSGHRRDEPVASLRDGLDAGARGVSTIQQPPEHRDVASQAVLLDEGVWPHLAHQLILADHAAPLPHQHQQGVEGLRCQGNNGACAKQHAVGRIELELAELVDRKERLVHGRRAPARPTAGAASLRRLASMMDGILAYGRRAPPVLSSFDQDFVRRIVTFRQRRPVSSLRMLAAGASVRANLEDFVTTSPRCSFRGPDARWLVALALL